MYFLKANVSFITGLMLLSYSFGVSRLETYKPPLYWIIVVGAVGLLNLFTSIILLALYKSRKRKIGESIYSLASLATSILFFASGLFLGVEAVKVVLKHPALFMPALIPPVLLVLAALFYLWLAR